MRMQTDEYKQIVELLQAAKARARSNRRARNQARTDLRIHLAIRLGEDQEDAGLLEFLNNRIRDLEMATEADAQTTLIAKVISSLLAESAWEKISESPDSPLLDSDEEGITCVIKTPDEPDRQGSEIRSSL